MAALAATRYGEISPKDYMMGSSLRFTEVGRYAIKINTIDRCDGGGPKKMVEIVDNHGQKYGPFLVWSCEFPGTFMGGSGGGPRNCVYDCVPSKTSHLTPLSHSAIDFIKTGDITPVMDEIDYLKAKVARLEDALFTRLAMLESRIDTTPVSGAGRDDYIGNLPEVL